MLAVAVVGISLGATLAVGGFLRWQASCLAKAEEHKRLEDRLSLMEMDHGPGRGFHPYLSAKYANQAAHHARLRRKWELAADRPWSTMDPDPPEPR
jgi:hypothetical protein